MSIRKYPFDYSVAYFDVDKNEFEYLVKQFIKEEGKNEEEEDFKRSAYRITVSPRVSNLPPKSLWGNDKEAAVKKWHGGIYSSLQRVFDEHSLDIVCDSLIEVDEKGEKIEIEGFHESRIKQIQIKTRIEVGKIRNSLHGHILVIIDHSTRVKLLYQDIEPKIQSILNYGGVLPKEKNHYIHLKWIPNAGSYNGGSGAEQYLMKKE